MFSFEKIDITKYWEFDEEWCDRNIESKYDLNKRCRHANAEFTLCYFIYNHGLEIHTNIKWLNRKIQSIKNGDCDKMNSSEIDDFNSNLCRSSGGYWWDNLADSKLELEMINYEDAPSMVVKVINHVLSLLDEGVKTHNIVENYLEQLEKEKQLESDIELTRSEKIEMKHVKVKEGFVYILSHPMMPGIHKIGFTARNPDVRVRELSRQIGLPGSFNIYKYWRTADPYIVEQRIQQKLLSCLRGGEYYEGDPDMFSEIVEEYLISE